MPVNSGEPSEAEEIIYEGGDIEDDPDIEYDIYYEGG
jgi:hypothetical protein